jgi:hypothetical protein
MEYGSDIFLGVDPSIHFVLPNAAIFAEIMVGPNKCITDGRVSFSTKEN